MSRSGYVDDRESEWGFITWRGAVMAAIRGKRGQAFLEEMLQAMAVLPEPKLINYDLERDGAVCAIGAVGKARGLDMTGLDPDDYETVAAKFGIARALAQEIFYLNDEASSYNETPERRFERMRHWIEENLFEGPALSSTAAERQCKHKSVHDGPRVEAVYGTAPTQICDCGMWRTNLHIPGPWQAGPIPSTNQTAADRGTHGT